MKFLLTNLLLLFSLSVFSQAVKSDSVYRKVDVPAEFPGGKERMNSYINFRLKSDQSTWNTKEGTVTIECIIETDGRIKEVVILKSLDPMFDEHLVQLFIGMPKWKPAMVK